MGLETKDIDCVLCWHRCLRFFYVYIYHIYTYVILYVSSSYNVHSKISLHEIGMLDDFPFGVFRIVVGKVLVSSFHNKFLLLLVGSIVSYVLLYEMYGDW